ncbi:DUF2946 domain-containing protein [Acidovorax sp. NCPPB 3859]|nr:MULTISPECIES: DUF2946 family protein [unclassified Acidovorax]MDA8452887.1 DUF2946 domain-containing protein [Acidovorax sp. GBBC 3297]MDA8462270.1 DUF2946 domain-containing protein [Acidovorax sp. GBBC 3333]MDA8467329.1 DUF2946 domain-containing protein [Acidovorax sp. GBBC 3332]MDA8472338.1 DUF2946 domain-containing protein [Acidovorax sp. GBBC 3299]WCM78289.1 DUF2946 domain-containing protein [Acidovorax sp. GBBC 712]
MTFLLPRLRRLAPLVLAWWMLAFGMAAASPLLHPQSLQVVCNAAGAAKLVAVQDDGSGLREMGQHGLDCALCLAPGAPPPAPQVLAVPMEQPLAHVLQPVEAARLAALVGAPLPARGPPARA